MPAFRRPTAAQRVTELCRGEHQEGLGTAVRVMHQMPSGGEVCVLNTEWIW